MELMEEMRTIKALLERQLAGFAWGEMAREAPIKALLLSEMLEAGFSSALARRLVQELPDGNAEEPSRRWLRAAVNRRLRTLPADADFIMRNTRHCHGFYGASSMERLPLERALTEQVRKFKAIGRAIA